MTQAIVTLVDLLRLRADIHQERGYCFLVDGDTQEQCLSYRELWQKAAALAARLQELELQDERVLLMYPPGMDFVVAFFGCLLARVVAVPVYPPEPTRLERSLRRLVAIAQDADARAILSTAAVCNIAASILPQHPQLERLRLIASDVTEPTPIVGFEPPPIAPGATAFLQYTSGSTASPKGVIVTHQNILHNERVIEVGFRHDEHTRFAGWLPLFHDMGLIGICLHPLFLGVDCVLLSPLSFLQRPVRWLRAISRYRSTTSGGPNFGYDLCVRKVTEQECVGLDLSSWRVAFNGAEPIRSDTLDRFYARFQAYGLRRDALYPCYGLAEATLLVAGKSGSEPVTLDVDGEALAAGQAVPLAADHPRSRRLVSSGRSFLDVEVAIVSPTSRKRCGAEEVGEIWIKGPSVAAGYFRAESQTAAAFQLRLADEAEGEWFASGDLGFLHAGELYVTGRLKDLIIIRGRNIYPQDVEGCVESADPRVRAGCSAAFSYVEAGEERLAVVAEVENAEGEEALSSILRAMRARAAEQDGLELDAVVLIARGATAKTSSGKIQRHACRAAYLAGTLSALLSFRREPSPEPALPVTAIAPAASVATAPAIAPPPAGPAPLAPILDGHVRARLLVRVSELVKIPAEQIDPEQPLASYGLSSLRLVELSEELSRWTGRALPPTLLYDHPSIAAISRHLAQAPAAPRASSQQASTEEPIAIIAMGCRYPGAASTPDALWQLIRNGQDAVTEIPLNRWDVESYFDPNPDTAGTTYSRWGGFLGDLARFDASFFGLSELEAENLDPQQRLLLETSWEAIERAGLQRGQLQGSRTGVFVGLSGTEYQLAALADTKTLNAYSYLGSAHSTAAGRLSYWLGLVGPCLAIDTACSSSLVAVHLACQSLRAGECEMALAGGVNVLLGPQGHIFLSRLRALSPRGRCSTFSAAADGYVRAEGCGMVLLKRQSDAQRDGDPILAVIRGTAINQDGKTQGLTAPNGLAQERVIQTALAHAGLEPASISYVECHGTGTALGDPIEVRALAAAYGPGRGETNPLHIGSIKTNIGHCEGAAGIAGLQKTVLALQHQELPPSLHSTPLNPYIPWSALPLRVTTNVSAWTSQQGPRRAGVSSFGFSGTNAHIIVEEAPPAAPSGPAPTAAAATALPFVLSALSATALRLQAESLSQHIQAVPDHDFSALADLAYALFSSRTHFAHRLVLFAADRAQLFSLLAGVSLQSPSPAPLQGMGRTAGKRVFVYPGQGSQWPQMARGLWPHSAVFRQTLTECAHALSRHLSYSLLDVLLEVPGALSLERVEVVQPALFAMMLALTAVWRSLGVEPDAVIGHSQGEVAAACVAGALTLEQGARIVALRSLALRRIEGHGGMAAVDLSEAEVHRWLQPFGTRLALAGVHAKRSCLVAGDDEALSELLRQLTVAQIFARPIRVRYASHSPQVEAIRAELRQAFLDIAPRQASLPIYSTVRACRLAGPELDGEYWYENLRSPIQFLPACELLLADGHRFFIEVSPHPALAAALQQTFDARSTRAVTVASLRREHGTLQDVQRSLFELWTNGLEISWPRELPRGRRVELPTYAFERKRHVRSAGAPAPSSPADLGLRTVEHALLTARVELADSEEILFTAALSPQRVPWLSEHTVWGQALVPGTAFLELALAAAHSLGVAGVEELVLSTPLWLARHASADLQLRVAPPDAQGQRLLRIYSRPQGSAALASFTLHASGRLLGTPPFVTAAAAQAVPADAIELSLDDLYERLARRGLRYGPSFRCVQQVLRHGNALYSKLALPTSLLQEAPRYGLHPALFDAALHPLVFLDPEEAATTAWLPYEQQRVHVQRRGATELLARLELVSATAEERIVRLILCDEAGGYVGRLDQLVLRRIQPEAVPQAGGSAMAGLCSVVWHEATLPAHGASPRNVLVWGASDRLAQQLGYRRIASLAELLPMLRGQESDRVHVLWDACESADPSRSTDAAQTLCQQGVSRLQEWTRASLPAQVELVVLTREAVATGREDPVAGFIAAGLWGLLRSVRCEYPMLRLRLLDLSAASRREEILAALQVEAEPDMALRQDHLYVPQLERISTRTETTAPIPWGSGTVLVTGGLGRLGHVVAQHLARVHGARYLLLLSRRGPATPAAVELRKQLAAFGADAEIVACDAGDRAELAKVLRSIDASRPLCAVVHCAGVLDDALLERVSPQQIDSVFHAKVDAALNLHELTAQQPLVAFLLFSSIAGVLGSAGQASYAAANALLDALAAHRRAHGLPAQSLAWGLWQPTGQGMTGSLTASALAQLRQQGLLPLSEQQGLDLFDQACGRPEPLLVPAAIAERTLTQLQTKAQGASRPHEQQPDQTLAAESPTPAPDGFVSVLLSMTQPARYALVERAVRTETAAVLALGDMDAVPVDEPLQALGMDSLQTVQLRNRIATKLGVRLELRDLWRLADPRGLAAEVVRRLESQAPAVIQVPSQEASGPPPGLAPITAPASPGQQRLWFLQGVLDPKETYHLCIAWRVAASLSPDWLQTALSTLAGRHEQLRCCFVESNGELRQCIVPWVQPILRRVDLSRLPEAAQTTALAKLVTQQGQEPFDLTRAPLWRMALVNLGANHSALILTWHHIATDGTSAGLFLKELSATYAELCSGKAPGAVPASSYVAHSERQLAWLHTVAAEQQRRYWRSRLQDLPVLDLPTTKPVPSPRSHRGEQRVYRLPKELSHALNAACQRHQCTPFVFLLAGFSVLLARWSRQDDFAIGTFVSGRSDSATESVIGFLVNTLPVRITLSDAPSVAKYLQRLGEQIFELLENQDLPLDELVKLSPSRVRQDYSRSPLFRTAFSLQQASWLPSTFADAATAVLGDSEWGSVQGTAKLDLSLTLMWSEEGYRAAFEYAVDVLEAAQVERMAAQLECLLAAMVEQPDANLFELPLLTDRERQQIVADWNQTRTEFPHRNSLPEQFAAQVERTPDAVAVVLGNQQLTYRELDTHAQRLAYQLQSMGVGPDVLVALCLDRSLDCIIALWGILKAGGAYVPLDPDAPTARLERILKDAKPALILTQDSLRSRVPEGLAPRVCLRELRQQPVPLSRPAGAITPEHLAYVMYTSGSTGQPKGVAIPHSAVLNLCHALAERAFGAPPLRVAWVASLYFDASVQQIFGALLFGHTLHIVDTTTRRDPQLLLQFLQQQRIHLADCTPSLLSLLLRTGLAECRDLSLRTLLCGGEALPTSLLTELFAEPAGSAITVINVYGPTETCVDVTAFPVSCKSHDRERPVVLLGKPLANTRLYVLDRYLRPVPIGIPGEIHIAGAGLARGYLNQPELSEQKFIADPFSSRPGERLYKTGDLARFLPDGTLEFLGRLDQQVKLRGYRIELGEIEAALAQHPHVATCAVLAREDMPGDQRLVAYVVPLPGHGLAPAALRAHLAATLPDYMLPSFFVPLAQLPLNTSGKVDRHALPAPEGPAERHTDFPARSPVEQLLCDVFAAVLRVRYVGPDDDFFAVGGHSLLATQLASRIRSTLAIDVPLRSLFAHPSPRALTDWIAAQADPAAAPLPPILPVDRDRPQPLSFAQQRLWFLEQLEPGRASYNISGALRLRGALDLVVLERALHALVCRHEALRTCFPQDGDHAVQHIQPPPEHITVRRQWTPRPPSTGDTELAQLLAREAAAPFVLATGPLFRVTLWTLADHDHVLLLSMHHAISDGWSLGVLLRELQALYGAFLQGLPSPLLPLALQTADVAVWERTVFTDAVLQPQLAYWSTQLAALSPLQLLTDRPRPAVRSQRGCTLAISLPAELTHSLNQLALQHGATLFMVLLAAFQALLSRYSGQDDIAVGTPIAHRNRSETEPLVGFFVNTLVLRSRLERQASFIDLLQQVKEVCLQAYAHQDAPFERVVELVASERDLSRTPLFQVMLVLQNAELAPLSLPDVHVELMDIESATAKFDLTVSLQELADGRLHGRLEYASDLWQRDSMERLWQHFSVLLHSAVTHPRSRLCDLPLLSEGETRQVLLDWNRTEVSYPLTHSVDALFSTQAERCPDAVAVVDSTEQLTYRQLAERTHRLAQRLRSLGVGPDVAVALFLDRSIDLVVAIFGVLAAGGAYLPLDPDTPGERLGFMLQDSQPRVVLTQDSLRGRLPDPAVPVLNVAEVARDAAPPASLASAATRSNLAYIIYTSGSTGQPKGVPISHGALLNLCYALRDRAFGESPQQVAWVAPVVFDGSVKQIFGALLFGHTLHIVDTPTRRDPTALLQYWQNHQIQLCDCTPSLLSLLVQAGLPQSAGLPLRTLLCGGEALPSTLLQELFAARHHDALSVINVYGPTECCVDVTAFRVSAVTLDPEQPTVLLGKPLPNTQLYILDERLNPLPIGVAGELHVAGAGVARGYLKRPELTAQKFIPNPFSASSESRLYKTGDRARFRPDGSIEFLGRLDYQVKLRGYRIEPGEIEAALSTHAAVADCVALVRIDPPNDPRLVAYVVPRPGAIPDGTELRAHLARKLPDYMVPAAFVILPKLPLSPNGKIDLRALPAPGVPALDADSAPPQTELEQLVAASFARVLGLPRVGRDENFFALGGHSLLAVRLQVDLHARLGDAMTLGLLFQNQSVRELAAALSHRAQATVVRPCIAIKSTGSRPPLFVLHGIGGTVFELRNLASSLSAEQPCIAIQAPGVEPGEEPFSSIEGLAVHYGQAILRQQPQGPLCIAGYSFGAVIAHELACQLLAAQRVVNRLILIDPPAPVVFDREDQPLAISSLLQGLGIAAAARDAVSLRDSDELLLSRLRQALPSSEILPSIDTEGMLRRLLKVYRQHRFAHAQHRPSHYKGCVHILRASHPAAPPATESWKQERSLAVQAWQAVVDQLVITEIPGDHFSVLREPDVGTLAAAIDTLLADLTDKAASR